MVCISGLSDAIMELFQLFANRSLCRLCAAGNFCVTTHLQDLPHIYARLYYCTSTSTHYCTTPASTEQTTKTWLFLCGLESYLEGKMGKGLGGLEGRAAIEDE